MTTPPGMTAANWRGHPHSPWAFRNVEAFLPVGAVSARARLRSLEPGSDLQVEGLAAFLRSTHADGFVVVHHGQVVMEYYAPGMTPASRHLCFSITKSLVGLLGELLISGGVVNGGARAADLVPELAGTGFGGATLRALLDMTDGVPFDENYADTNAQIHRYSKHFWGSGEGGVLAALRTLPGPADRSGSFAYRTPVSDVVGLMLERAAGRPLENLVATHIWGPAGAGEACWVRDTGGRAIASAGLACTLRDLARIGLWLVGTVGGQGATVLAAAVASIAGGGDRAAFAASDQPTRPGFSYRSHWWIDHAAGAWNAYGVFGQRLHVVPSANLVIARFGSHPTASNALTDAEHARVFAAIRTALD